MPLYIFWVGLCLGVWRLAAEARRQDQNCIPLKAITQRYAARHQLNRWAVPRILTVQKRASRRRFT